MKMQVRVVVLAGILSLGAMDLAAQQGRPPQPPTPPTPGQRPPVGHGMHMRAPMHRGAMRDAGDAAAMLLRMRDRLELSDDQVKRLEVLEDRAKEKRGSGPESLRIRADLMEALQKDDLAGARAAMERASKLRIDLAMERLQARKAARDVLTAEQRERLEEVGEAMRMRMRRGPDGFAPGGHGRPGAGLHGRPRMRSPMPPAPPAPPES